MENSNVEMCPLCNGNKYIITDEDKPKKCKCLIQEEIKQYLPSNFRKYPISKAAFPYKDFMQNIVYKTTLAKFGSFINTFLTYMHLKNKSPSYKIVTISTFTEQFFEGETNDYYNCDILILMLYGGYKNKLSGGYVNAILKDRILSDKQTIFFVDKTDYSDTKMLEYLGADVITTLTPFKNIKG